MITHKEHQTYKFNLNKIISGGFCPFFDTKKLKGVPP